MPCNTAVLLQVNIPFGSGIISNSTGILLNDEMDDFAQPNKSSSVTPHAAEANFIAPGRRPLSAMSPMFAVERSSGRLVAAAGASGGPLIVSATLQTLARWVAVALHGGCVGKLR
jgi:gamma-glutamyltranspeptidase